MGIQSFKDLQVWNKSVELVAECYKLTNGFPKVELFGLVAQLRRSAVSIPANVAEGHARFHRKEYLHHLSIAHGSIAELETHIHISNRLSYISDEAKNNLLVRISEIGKMLNGLMRSLRD